MFIHWKIKIATKCISIKEIENDMPLFSTCLLPSIKTYYTSNKNWLTHSSGYMKTDNFRYAYGNMHNKRKLCTNMIVPVYYFG